MKANPGGYIPPQEVIGRDQLIELLWRMALVGFQGRGFAAVVQPNCCRPFLLEALLFQWP